MSFKCGTIFILLSVFIYQVRFLYIYQDYLLKKMVRGDTNQGEGNIDTKVNKKLQIQKNYFFVYNY
jgi:hypothetical protein